MSTITNLINKLNQYFRQPSETASVAKDRLQIIISHERSQRDKPEYWSALQKDLLDVIAKYVDINKEDMRVELARQEGCSVLELNVILPSAEVEKSSVLADS